MDYSIAILVPSTEVAESAKKTMQRLHLDYPVEAASTIEAVRKAKELIPMGLQLVITHGLTYSYLQKHVNVALLELPFGGLDVLETVKKALKAGDRIVHLGTKPFGQFIRRSLRILGIDEDYITFYELNMKKPLDEQIQSMLLYDFNVFIGGYPTVYAARKAGKIGIEFNVSQEIIQTTIKNAQTMVDLLKQKEKDQAMYTAILQTSTDGLIVTDEKDAILFMNPAARNVFRHSSGIDIGQNIYDAFEQSKIIVSENIKSSKQLMSDDYTPVILKKSPFALGNTTKGTVISIKKVSEINEMQYRIRNDLINKGFVAKHTFKDIIGNSKPLTAAKEKALIYAGYDSTVLIYGETGTGKELFAQGIHRASKRKNQPFVAVNCAALPENLIESELFGYVKGAFTGASSQGKTGLFEQANMGTIFLDEISEIPVSVQSKLLRVIQEGDIIRIGGDKVIHVDIRIICSSNKDLLKLSEEGKFKIDLYYRLSTLEINIPPLRDRPDDIIPLANALLYKSSQRHNKVVTSFSTDALTCLLQMKFPGNVRQLENLIERMVILSTSPIIDMDTMKKCDLPVQEDNTVLSYVHDGVQKASKNLKDIQADLIMDALSQCNGNKTAAARMLGIHPSTLWRKCKKMEIEV